MEAPVTHELLDGQIVMEPVHDLSCDALPAGECGCGSAVCTGGCAAPQSCNFCNGSGCSTCGELCSPNAWRPCITLCTPQDGWVSFEFLSWYQDGLRLPPLVTTSVDPNVTRANAGVLTDPSTRVLFGGDKVLDNAFSGGRLRFGVWLDSCHTWGLGAEFIGLESKTENFFANSNGDPVLSRPIFNTSTGVEDIELVAFPNVVSGSVGVNVRSELTGGSFHIRRLRRADEGCRKWLFCGCPEHYCSRAELLVGYRHLDLQEGVLITEDLVSTDTANPGTFKIADGFQTRNQFNGLDLGWMFRRTRGFWTFDGQVKLAFGVSRQRVTIDGTTTINDPSSTPQNQTFPSGVLAASSNIGVYQQDEFAVVPEVGMNIGYQLTDHLRASFGYTFIYWSNVVRPGQHISRDLNPALLPPPADPFTGTRRPAFAFDTTDYWAQGLNVGLEYRW